MTHFPRTGVVGALISWHQKGCGDAFSSSFVSGVLSSGTAYAGLSTAKPSCVLPGSCFLPPLPPGRSQQHVVFSPGFIYLSLRTNLVPRDDDFGLPDCIWDLNLPRRRVPEASCVVCGGWPEQNEGFAASLC